MDKKKEVHTKASKEENEEKTETNDEIHKDINDTGRNAFLSNATYNQGSLRRMRKKELVNHEGNRRKGKKKRRRKEVNEPFEASTKKIPRIVMKFQKGKFDPNKRKNDAVEYIEDLKVKQEVIVKTDEGIKEELCDEKNVTVKEEMDIKEDVHIKEESDEKRGGGNEIHKDLNDTGRNEDTIPSTIFSNATDNQGSFRRMRKRELVNQKGRNNEIIIKNDTVETIEGIKVKQDVIVETDEGIKNNLCVEKNVTVKEEIHTKEQVHTKEEKDEKRDQNTIEKHKDILKQVIHNYNLKVEAE